MYSLSY